MDDWTLFTTAVFIGRLVLHGVPPLTLLCHLLLSLAGTGMIGDVALLLSSHVLTL